MYGHEAEIPYPCFAEQIDYELEIGYVVGTTGRNLTPEQAEAGALRPDDLQRLQRA